MRIKFSMYFIENLIRVPDLRPLMPQPSARPYCFS